jgi:hypothetical protein
VLRRVQAFPGPRAGRRHVDVEDLRELRLAGHEREEGTACGPQDLFVRYARAERARRGDDPADHQVPALLRGGQEAVFFVGEVRVEGGP